MLCSCVCEASEAQILRTFCQENFAYKNKDLLAFFTLLHKFVNVKFVPQNYFPIDTNMLH